MTDTAVAVPPQRGDETALYREHAAPLIRAVRRAVNTSDATIEDACHFAWAQLLRRQPEREFIFGWLRTTAIREAWELSSRECRFQSLDFQIGAGRDAATLAEIVPGKDLQLTIDAREALEAVASLQPKPRYALARLVAGLSHKEIQAEGRLSPAQVNRHLSHARAALRA